MTSWESASASELKAAQQAIDSEYRRREQMDAQAQAEKFRAELQEVREGKRAVGDEHLAYLSPRETLEAVNRGQVAGVGADRRLRRGR